MSRWRCPHNPASVTAPESRPARGFRGVVMRNALFEVALWSSVFYIVVGVVLAF
jgi:hypothetical protein